MGDNRYQVRASTVSQLMTARPVVLATDCLLGTAATTMASRGVTAVVVLEGNKVRGVVTEREIAARAVTEKLDPAHTCLGALCGVDPVTLVPTATIDSATALMREHGVESAAVTENGIPVGIISIADLAANPSVLRVWDRNSSATISDRLAGRRR